MPTTRSIRLERCANGQLCLCLGQIGWLALLKLRWHLRWREGFRREGRRVIGLGEAVAPDYVRGTLRLLVGGDSWSGPYLMAEDEAGSRYLEQLYGSLTLRPQLFPKSH